MRDIHVVDLKDLDGTQVGLAGGKGANLGELMRIEGVRVPPGFCVTTGAASADPDVIAHAITEAVEPGTTYAVRSSATAEDAPTASFAGQHDSFLDVGADAVAEHVRRCWASVSTERALAYRRQAGIDDADIAMAVVVQAMVHPRASGVLFTADPATGNRLLSSIEAAPGLGEGFVSGRVGADLVQVRDGAVLTRATATEQPLLTDGEALELARLGRRIEAHFGEPQDIEWCLDDDGFAIVQSRPITTLFPVPVADDDAPHVYVSVGHQQMMTDAMRPLGLSLWQRLARPRMYEAGGRLFVDVAAMLAAPATRDGVVKALTDHDPLTGGALEIVLERGSVPLLPDAPAGSPAPPAPPAPLAPDSPLPHELIERGAASNAALEQRLQPLSGPAVLDAIDADIPAFKQVLHDPRSAQVYTSAMDASAWLNEHLLEWLGERNAADALTQSVPNNVTSEMGLALLDVADAVRPHPEVVAFLRGTGDDEFLEQLDGLAGGAQARAAIGAFLDRYGMRCVGEIDITRPRWRERPAALLPLLLGNVDTFAPGEGARRFERGRAEALARREDLLARLRALPEGERKAADTAAAIDRLRAFSGYREHPKSFIVARLAIYKRALMAEVRRLVAAGILHDEEDSSFLTFAELQDASRAHTVDHELIARRKHAFAIDRTRTPPRVMTSEGEMVTGSYGRDGAPSGALTGLPVSSGVVEGRARVVLDMTDASLDPGDILVTAFTDPGWTPLFVAAAGLVTEVGGLMTHGAVIAREYGLPAVVGVQRATGLIEDGQRIRVNGTEGYVEVLPAS